MKEVLTKKFWQDVKKTFDEAKDGRPAAPPPAAINPSAYTGQPADNEETRDEPS